MIMIQEELTVEAIEDDTAIIKRTNYSNIEYPLSWIPFEVQVGDVLIGVVRYCGENVVSRIDFDNQV